MMILIADSGSTKTEWRLLARNKISEVILGKGINPYYQTGSEITQLLEIALKAWRNYPIYKIYFYGAGCHAMAKKKVIKNALCHIFSLVEKKNVIVESDLLASARSSAGNQKGVVGIIGTGSTASFYDGKTFPNYQPSLGFLLGDEGSGADLGRQFVRAFLRKELPTDLYHKFNKTYQLTPQSLMNHVYQDTFPNRYLAHFMPFLHENVQEDFIQQILLARFDLFFKNILSKISGYQTYPFFLVGSVAFYFQKELIQVAQNHNVSIKKIIQRPSLNLEVYHQKELHNLI